MLLLLQFFLVGVLLCISPVIRAESVHTYTAENGLPHNRVNWIYPDSGGYLWVCTDGGLSRFDGSRFVNYTTAHGIPHKLVNSILETRTGEYWIASDGGISRYDPNPGKQRFITFVPAGSEDSRHVNSLLEDLDGSLLLATSNGVFRFQPNTLQPRFEPVQLGDQKAAAPLMVNSMTLDPQGNLYLATNNGLYRRNRNGLVNHYRTQSCIIGNCRPSDPPAFIDSIATDREGRLWLAFPSGFGRLALNPGGPKGLLDLVVSDPAALGGRVRTLHFASDGRRWVATQAGLREWILDSSDHSRFLMPQSIAPYAREVITAISEDQDGNLWIGTRRSGLVHLAKSPLQTFTAQHGLRLSLDQVLLQPAGGRVSVLDIGASSRQLFVQENDGTFQSLRLGLPPDASVNTLQMAAIDHLGAFWFSTAAGLSRTLKISSPPDLRLVPGCATNRFFEDASGDIWFSHWCKGAQVAQLGRWDRRTGLVQDETFRLPDSARSGISAFAQDRSGAIWIASQRHGGLFRLKNGRFHPLTSAWPGFTNQLFLDSGGRLWATSTTGGLALIQDPLASEPELKRYTSANGLTSDEVWTVIEDRWGLLCAGTARGVSCLDPATGSVVSYTLQDGLTEGDIRSALRDSNGDLWFASAHGVSRLRPSGQDLSVLPPPRVMSIRLAGIPLPVSDLGEPELKLPPLPSDQNSIQIDFAISNFRLRAPLQYEFALTRTASSSQSTRWNNLGRSATLNLIGLSPGDYALQLRAVSPGGLRGKHAWVAFSISEPFWQSWWFQSACLLTVCALVYWSRTRYLKQELAIQRVRQMISMDLHDEIGAGLSRIAILGEAAKGHLSAGDEVLRGMLDEVSRSSRALVAEMSDIVWSLDSNRDQVGELTGRLRALGSDLIERQGATWTVHPPEEGVDIRLPLNMRRQIYLVFREAIHNAAKHARATEVTLRFEIVGSRVQATLTDNGVGFIAPKTTGSGLNSMARRASDMGGTLEVQSTPGKGTVVRLVVPLSGKA